jgi:hypothetical protein
MGSPSPGAETQTPHPIFLVSRHCHAFHVPDLFGEKLRLISRISQKSSLTELFGQCYIKTVSREKMFPPKGLKGKEFKQHTWHDKFKMTLRTNKQHYVPSFYLNHWADQGTHPVCLYVLQTS